MKKFVLVLILCGSGCYQLPHNYPVYKCNGDKICRCQECGSINCAFSGDCKCEEKELKIK
jgi:hypothetical protein